MLRALAITLLTAAAAHAQVRAGRIVGAILDATKATIPGAQVTVTNTETNTAPKTTSNATGDSGGRILREDAVRFFDFSAFKVFRIQERHRIEFRGEFFNLTNTASFLAPSTDVDTANGGRVTGTSNIPRQIQLALKYSF
ncbi:MAG: hypothetical protein HY235_20380 [Acidobacteria bacterium]|nr:hypothetical protein [Acidobacteriota bacterium]